MLRPLTLPLIDDRRGRRIFELITVLWVLSVADLVFTIWAHLFTPFHELNPIARAMLQNGQFLSLILMKLVLTTIGATIFWRLRARPSAEIGLWLMVMVYVALTMRWSDYTQAAPAIAVGI